MFGRFIWTTVVDSMMPEMNSKQVVLGFLTLLVASLTSLSSQLLQQFGSSEKGTGKHKNKNLKNTLNVC